jgi:hypothetical protein
MSVVAAVTRLAVVAMVAGLMIGAVLGEALPGAGVLAGSVMLLAMAVVWTAVAVVAAGVVLHGAVGLPTAGLVTAVPVRAHASVGALLGAAPVVVATAWASVPVSVARPPVAVRTRERATTRDGVRVRIVVVATTVVLRRRRRSSAVLATRLVPVMIRGLGVFLLVDAAIFVGLRGGRFCCGALLSFRRRSASLFW